MTSADEQLVRSLTCRITAAGITLVSPGLTRVPGGADNLVFTARTPAGRELIVKTPRAGREARYATAAWASRTLASHGIPAPEVIWHDASSCVEAKCAGQPLTGDTSIQDTSGIEPSPAALRAARRAGTMLRRVHDITVAGYGKLRSDGTGPHTSLLDSLRSDTHHAPLPPSAPAGTRSVIDRALPELGEPVPRLLLGDCAARHIYADPVTAGITGLIDLESARGGDPLADLAGFSIREHPRLTSSLLSGYFPSGASRMQQWALTIHRARIAEHLLRFHASLGEHAQADRFAAVLAAEFAAITARDPSRCPVGGDSS